MEAHESAREAHESARGAHESARADHEPAPEEAVEPIDLLEEAERLIGELRSHQDPEVAASVDRLLQDIDAVHRTGLTRLVSAIHGMAGEAFIHRLCADPAIRLLLMSYDLVAVDRRLMAEEALDPVRGHLHAHGIDVELVDVVGSVVYVRLHPPVSDEPLLLRIHKDLEEALNEGLPGFQELEIGDRRSGASGLVQIGGLEKARKPVHRAVAEAGELDEGMLLGVQVDELPILLARIEGEVYGLRNRCGDSPLPLEYGTLEGHTLVCSWHGCRYDVRTGAGAEGRHRVDVFPVRESNGRIEIAVATRP